MSLCLHSSPDLALSSSALGNFRVRRRRQGLRNVHNVCLERKTDPVGGFLLLLDKECATLVATDCSHYKKVVWICRVVHC